MHVDLKTQLWLDLTPEEIQEMKQWVEDVVLHGKIAPCDPPWLLLWYKELGYSLDRDRLLLQSVAVPQRVLLSIVKALCPTGVLRMEQVDGSLLIPIKLGQPLG